MSIPSAQPVAMCLQTLLFKLQPGITLTHKPPPIRVASPRSPVATGLRTAAAFLAVAVPAAAVAAFTAHSGVPLPWSHRLPGQPAVQAALKATGAVQPDERAAGESTASRRAPSSSTRPHTHIEVPLLQQVAFAKDITMKLRGQLWHGLRRGVDSGHTSTYPAVFHVTVAEGSCSSQWSS